MLSLDLNLLHTVLSKFFAGLRNFVIVTNKTLIEARGRPKPFPNQQATLVSTVRTKK